MALWPSRRLYARLYAAFLGVLLAIGLASTLLFFLVGRPRARPPDANLATRLASHLARALQNTPDDQLRDTLASVHDEMELDIAVVGLDGTVRAQAGTPIPTLPRPFIERARHGAAWLPPPLGVVAAPLEDGPRRELLVIRLPGPAQHRHFLRRLLLLAAGLAITAGLLYPLSRSISRPLERLTQTAEAFGKGDLTARSGIVRSDEVGQLARTFDEMADRIQNARRAERELLANVSHELRTPLARIKVALELLGPQDAAARLRIASVGEEVDELSRLVGDVLTASRLDLSALPLRKTALGARALLLDARERALALEPGRTIEVLAPEELTVPADPSLLSRVLDNLIDNARKYDASGRPLRVEARRDGADVLLAVIDQGPGIPPEDLGSVFDPFFRGGNARSSTPGFGLGLSLARRVAEAHGGTIRAANEPQGGARFELRLPATDARVAGAPGTAA